MAIRAAIASNTNITYKILFNDAVATLEAAPMMQACCAAGHAKSTPKAPSVSLSSPTQPDKYPSGARGLIGLTIHHRDDLDEVQKSLPMGGQRC